MIQATRNAIAVALFCLAILGCRQSEPDDHAMKVPQLKTGMTRLEVTLELDRVESEWSYLDYDQLKRSSTPDELHDLPRGGRIYALVHDPSSSRFRSVSTTFEIDFSISGTVILVRKEKRHTST